MTMLLHLQNFLSQQFALYQNADRTSFISPRVPKNLHDKINWDGPPATFFHGLLAVLAQAGKETLVEFLARLKMSEDVFGVDQQKYLANLLNAIERLTSDQWVDEFTDLAKIVKEFFDSGGVDLVKFDEQALAPKEEVQQYEVQQYYEGAQLKWGVIAAHGDVERDQSEELLKKITMQTNRTRIFCISGEPGSGKTTFAWRVAAEASQVLHQPLLHIRRIEIDLIWYKLNDFIQEHKIPFIILVDDVFRNDGARDTLVSLDSNSSVTIIATSRSNEIPDDLPPYSIQVFPLNPPTSHEKIQVLQKLGLKESNLDLAQQKRLQEADSWIVMMMEVTTGEALSKRVNDNVNRLQQQDHVIYEAYKYLCYAGQYDLAVPESLIAALDAEGRFYKLLEHPGGKGLIFSDTRLEGRIRTQHPTIANMALKKYSRVPFVLLKKFLSSTQPDQRLHRHFLQNLLRSLMLNQEGRDVHNLLTQNVTVIDGILKKSNIDELVHWADLYALLGAQNKATELKQIALTKDPELPVDWLAQLKLIEQEGTTEQIAALIDETAYWLRAHPEDTIVRQAHLGLVQRKGTLEQFRSLIDALADWVSTQPENNSIRRAYLKILAWEGTSEQVAKLFSVISSWAANNVQNPSGQKAIFLNLLENYRSPEQIKRLIDSITAELEIHIPDHHAIELQRRLIERYGTEEQLSALMRATSSWLATHPQDVQIRSLYLGLVGSHGTAEQIAELISDTDSWLAVHPQDAEVRSAYLELVRQRGTGEQCAALIPSTAAWLATNRRDAEVRRQYLKLVEEHGTTEQLISSLDTTAVWLLANAQDSRVCMIYFGLVGRAGTKKHLADLLNIIARWEMTDQKRALLFFNFQSLVEREWPKEQKRALMSVLLERLEMNVTIILPYNLLLDRFGTEEEIESVVEHRSSWLAANPQDIQVRSAYLKLLVRHGAAEQISVAIASTASWLEDHWQDALIRLVYLKLLDQRGTAEQCVVAIVSTASWLEENSEDLQIWSVYLELVRRFGTGEQSAAALESTASWLAANPQDALVRSAYLRLLERRGTVEQNEATIESTAAWLGTNRQDSQVRHAYLELVRRRGTAEQSAAALKSTAFWLMANPQDFQVRSAYLWLMEWWGTAEQIAATLESTEAWLADNQQDFQARRAYLELVRRRGTEDQSAVALASTEVWLADHTDDALVRSAYLKLLARRGTVVQSVMALRSTADWLTANPQDSLARSAYLWLMGRRGTSEQIATTLESTAAWLIANPQDFLVRSAYLELVKRHGTAEQISVALEATESWLADNPQDFQVRRTYVDLIRRRGTQEQSAVALPSTETWLADNPQDTLVRSAYLKLLERWGTAAQFTRAEGEVNDWVSNNPENIPVRLVLAAIEKRQGKYREARHLYEEAVNANRLNAASWRAWAILEKEQSNYGKARQLFQKATEVDPGHTASWQSWAMMEKTQGNYEEARRLFKKATEVDPGHAPSWQARALLEKELNSFELARLLFKKATDVDPKHIATWQSWATMEKELGKHEEARNLFREAARNTPKPAEMWLAWALMEKDLDNFELARQLFQKATDVDPKYTPSWQAWAIMEKERRDYDEARRLFGEATEADPRYARAWQAWAIMEKERGDYEEAHLLFQKATDVDPKHAPSWSAWAIMEKERGDYEEARRLFEEVTRTDPRNQYSWMPWAIMEKELGNYEKARELFGEAIRHKPEEAGIWSAWGLMEKERGDYEEARRLFREATRVGRQNTYGWQPWAIMEKELGNYEKARELFGKAIKMNPKQAGIWSAWGLMEKERGDYEMARRLFHEATRVGRKDIYGWQPWAIMEKELGNYDEARRLFGEAIKSANLQAAFPPWALLELEQGNLNKARQLAQQAVDIAPQNFYALMARGQVQQALGNLERTQADFEQAKHMLQLRLKQRPDDPRHLNLLGRVFTFMGDYQQAEALLLRSLEIALKSQKAFAHNGLGELYEAQGRFDEALDQWKKALEYFPHYLVAENNRRRILQQLSADGDAFQEGEADQEHRKRSDLDGSRGEEGPMVQIEHIASPFPSSESQAPFLESDYANLHPFERLAAAIMDKPREKRLEMLAETLQLQLPESLRIALTTLPSDSLIGSVYRIDGPPLSPPSVFGALLAMLAGEQAPPDDLVPLMPVDEASLACVVCCPKGSPLPAEYGQVVRWHLNKVRAGAQRHLLDVTVEDFLETAATDLKWRSEGIERMRQIEEEHSKMNGSGEGLLKVDQEKPIRLAVQNVIVGLAALRYESAFDALSSRVWQSCQVAHINVHEGTRALAAMTLAEAFRSGGTMEIRFDEHPEKAVPASLRQYGRTRGIVLGSEDPRAIAPAEARQLFLAVTQMPDELAHRVTRLTNTGIISPERACSLLLSGIWRPIELDFILATTTHCGSILHGGVEPFNRPARQAELAVCRAALMVGMLLTQFNQMVIERAELGNASEEEPGKVSWSILADHGAVRFDQVPPGALPWQMDWEAVIKAGQSLVVVPRPIIGSQEIEIAARLGHELNATGVTLQLYGAPQVKMAEASVPQLTCPEGFLEIDRRVEARLLACKVGRI